MTVRTVNPFTEETLEKYDEEGLDQVKAKIDALKKAQRDWKLSLEKRLEDLKQVRKRLESSVTELGTLMTSEMGKPVTQSEAELKKCLWLIDYVVENADAMLAPDYVKTEAKKSYVRFDPLGTILLVMPWNFPAWQVMRAAVPALTAGNSVLLKHASIVSGSSLKLREIFGLDSFDCVVTTGDVATAAIKYVDGVSFTGSTSTGSKIAEEAGKQLKKGVFELGGSDPFIVIDGSNIEECVKNAVFARLQNNGQSCIASKRFLVYEKIYKEFYERFRNELSKVRIGNPLERSTFLGPLASREQKETVSRQLEKLASLGSVEQLVEGLQGNFVAPSIVRTDAVFDEEVFGPVAILKRFETHEQAVRLANETPYGLGSCVWGDPKEAEKLVPHIEAGMVFINKIVTSDPRLPFGGVKKSGVGYELSRYGMLEFTSKKTVWVN